MTRCRMCAALAVCGFSGTSMAITFIDYGQASFQVTGWTSAGGLSQAGLPVGIGVTASPASSSPGGPGITEGTGISQASSSNSVTRPNGLQMGDAGTGVGARADALGSCLPTGFAFNSNMGTGTLTVVNTTAAAWTLGWVFDYSWSTTLNGSDPAHESGTTQSEVTLFADGNELQRFGPQIRYTPGGTQENSDSVNGSSTIPANSQIVFYTRAYVVGSITATPAPGGSAALGLAMGAAALRRRRGACPSGSTGRC